MELTIKVEVNKTVERKTTPAPLFLKGNRLGFLIISLILLNTASAQVKEEWFPSGLTIKPFEANFLEPKQGFSFMQGESKLRLDISTSEDIFRKEDGNSTFSFGGDLFTFTRLRAENDFHFPVEAIDYLFGFNGGYKITNENDEYGFRLRFSHISAHLVDGDFDNTIMNWRAGDQSRVYSREFLELMPYYKYKDLRTYVGLTYLVHVIPNTIGRGIYQAGFEYYMNWIKSPIFVPYVAYDFKLDKIGSYTGNNIFTAGIKLGKPFEKGFTLAYSYFSGKSVQGEYYDRNESYSTLGFNLDL